MDGVVPIITGFLAEDHDGNVTTLGRGGSDTTAVMLGNYMDADEVVIVTDVEGVMTGGDPGGWSRARNVNVGSSPSTTEPLVPRRGRSSRRPLSYKDEDLAVRVVHYQHGDLLRGGTRIEGEFESLIDMREEPLACLTIAGRAIRNRSGILSLANANAPRGGDQHRCGRLRNGLGHLLRRRRRRPRRPRRYSTRPSSRTRRSPR